ncbi:LysR family transcriptional regulator [Lachnoclostridium sp. An196]|uniref:LysR family transcriptional regulator n=1 Tax=Lachnoclostridium sp. An196 TaxID=1965583 RepID=UPI000B3653DE|nr:LysR family transcriptional regulator [Lachnoclostridium sp. An196]OUP19475.1 LysR family transcriptional regulator [Lachnoclostridium sp. An196]
MELRVLRYFLEVAREENVTHAAQRLHVSQPTLSRQIKELEDELGKKLFARSNYSIKLTEEGMLLRKRAEDILEMADKTLEEFKSLDEINGGDIHIGCAESNGIAHVIRVIKSLQKKYPRIRYHFYSSGTDAVSERLDRGLLDVAVIIQEVDLSKYNYLKVPSSDRWGLIMRKDSPLAEHSCIHLNDLMNIPLILSRQAMREEMPRWFGETQDKLNIVATYDLLFNTSVMVREGFGYVLGFDGLVNTGPDSDICFQPLEPALESPMYIIWKKYQMFTPVASLLLEELKRDFGSL